MADLGDLLAGSLRYHRWRVFVCSHLVYNIYDVAWGTLWVVLGPYVDSYAF